MAAMGAGLLAARRNPRSAACRTVLAVGLFSLGLLPQGIQRVDGTHFAWASAVSLGFLPVGLSVLLGRPGSRTAVRNVVAAVLPVALVVRARARRAPRDADGRRAPLYGVPK